MTAAWANKHATHNAKSGESSRGGGCYAQEGGQAERAGGLPLNHVASASHVLAAHVHASDTHAINVHGPNVHAEHAECY